VANELLDHETIARAMKRAAWIAEHGTPEQRAVRFMPNVPESSLKNEEQPTPDRK
jgi:hypothetical protein